MITSSVITILIDKKETSLSLYKGIAECIHFLIKKTKAHTQVSCRSNRPYCVRVGYTINLFV